MSPTYIDFDWNEVKLYDENFDLVFVEPNMVLRNLKDETVLFVGQEAKENLKLDLNLLAIVPIENGKVNSLTDLQLVLKHLVDKYHLTDYLIVDRYQLDKLGVTNLISEQDYLRLQFSKEIFVDIRNNETIIYNVEKNQLTKLDRGRNKILTDLNRYFNLNFNATLNTTKTLKLLDELQTKKVQFVSCRSFLTKEDLVVEVDYDAMINDLLLFKQEILSMIKPHQPVIYSTNFEKVFSLGN